jgi:prolyl-tRNA synthetase
MNISFTDENGEKKNTIMGCYGIGISRLMASIAELNIDDKGLVWPIEVAPFKTHLISILSKDEKKNKEIEKVSEKLYSDLDKLGISVLYDDRFDLGAGERFSDSDLIGIPFRIVISEKTLDKNSVELKVRTKEKSELVKIKKITSEIQKLI